MGSTQNVIDVIWKHIGAVKTQNSGWFQVTLSNKLDSQRKYMTLAIEVLLHIDAVYQSLI